MPTHETLRLKSRRLGYLLDECQIKLRDSVELRCTSGSEFSLDVMFLTDFGEPAALQLRRVIRTDDFGTADVSGVNQVPVSYTHLRAPRDKRQSRMPSSA